jgi:hypothetical protein
VPLQKQYLGAFIRINLIEERDDSTGKNFSDCLPAHRLHLPLTNFCIAVMEWLPLTLFSHAFVHLPDTVAVQSSYCSKRHGTRYFGKPIRHSCRDGVLSIYPSASPSIRSQLRGNKVAGGRSHLSVNWTASPCSMQIRSIDWNTD